MIDESEARKDIVGTQREIEIDVALSRADGKLGAAIFFVPTMLTPLYINPDDVFQDSDGLFKLKEGKRLPEGLIPPEKAADPAQLSTVLGRVLSMRDMLEEGLPITVFLVNRGRPRVDNKAENVVWAEGSLIERYKERLKIVDITKEEYEQNKDSIAAASYLWWDQKGKMREAVFFASQINVPDRATSAHKEAPFDKLFDNDAQDYISAASRFGAKKDLRGLIAMCLNSCPKRNPVNANPAGIRKHGRP